MRVPLLTVTFGYWSLRLPTRAAVPTCKPSAGWAAVGMRVAFSSLPSCQGWGAMAGETFWV